jgi:RNA polymerase sigma-70 factor (ECF subfamily)
MELTPASLLEHVRNPADQAAWKRFVQIYTPLLYHWAHRVRLQDQDAADLVQDVFTVLVQKLPEFQYDRQRSFRAWLKTILLNKWRERQRRRAPLSLEGNGSAVATVAEEPEPDDLSETEYRQQLVQRTLQVIRHEFQPATWQAFWQCFIGGRPAPEVAREQGITVNAVYIAKCRVLRRLRRELDGLLD